ncbi:response regulator [Piscirickettsia litoralis]|uniref:Response regulatory domain-containing protein n=1 Tax=Piscirickettsia litoralis TaxID=1891921 RepID=A0ABX3A3F1_9GAMM|nr:response regulator [Piscirickettsia litoralis]ODN41950.1 hypothetical protein BGC07_01965 [Piscirickettsia litoralis]
MFKIIAVDDSETSLAKLKSSIDPTRFEIVATGKDGSELIDLYKKHHPHIVILDIIMEHDGIKALEQLIELSPRILVIMVSSLGEESKIKKAFDLGAAGYVVKPYDKEKLEIVLEAAIKQKKRRSNS